MKNTQVVVRSMVRTELTEKETALAKWLLEDHNAYVDKYNWNKVGKDKDGFVPVPYEFYGVNIYRLARKLKSIKRSEIQIQVKSFLGIRHLQFRLNQPPKCTVFR